VSVRIRRVTGRVSGAEYTGRGVSKVGLGDTVVVAGELMCFGRVGLEGFCAGGREGRGIVGGALS
jgi:hypothetical protein